MLLPLQPPRTARKPVSSVVARSSEDASTAVYVSPAWQPGSVLAWQTSSPCGPASPLAASRVQRVQSPVSALVASPSILERPERNNCYAGTHAIKSTTLEISAVCVVCVAVTSYCVIWAKGNVKMGNLGKANHVTPAIFSKNCYAVISSHGCL